MHSKTSRRRMLQGMAVLGAIPASAAAQTRSAAPPPSMRQPGEGFSGYGNPSSHEQGVVRAIRDMDGFPVAGSSTTPLERLEGIITPNGLHFERHHSGVPDISPDAHQLIVHGLVRRPLIFSIESLHRYPLESHVYFVECAGNSGFNTAATPPARSVGVLHGLLSVSEWTGVRLATVLEEAMPSAGASWVIAEGADGAAMSRSIPLEKCLDDALLALYQNGEAIRPEQGYPLRLILPGFEGNTQIKWLHRLKLTDKPAHSREETSRYTQLLKDGRSRQFDFVMGTKSVITKPSFGLDLTSAGLCEISGLAWSGHGRIKSVDISVDGGSSWARARLDGSPSPKSAVRFRLPWQWDGSPAVLMSKATDEFGGTQPMRSDWMREFGNGQYYHNNSIQAWSVSGTGEVANVFV